MRVKGLAAAAVAIALLMSGCALEGGAPLTIVTKDFAFEGMPQYLRGGGPFTATVRNEGRVRHELAFIDIGGASLDDFRREFPKVIEGGPWPDFMRRGSVPFDVGPGDEQTLSFTLEPGNYMLFCALNGDPAKPRTPDGDEAEGKPHYELGMVVPDVNVAGGGGELQAKDGEIVAEDYSFDVPKLGAGRRQLVFRNEGPKEWHHLVAFEFPSGTTEEAAIAAFQAFGAAEGTGQPPPPGTPEPAEAGYAGIVSPGMSTTFELILNINRTYLFACFISDRSGGPPHAVAHQMVKTFIVR